MYLMFLGVYLCESVFVDEGGFGVDVCVCFVRSCWCCIVSWIGDDFYIEIDKYKCSRLGW